MVEECLRSHVNHFPGRLHVIGFQFRCELGGACPLTSFECELHSDIEDDILVAHKDRVQDVKKVVERIRNDGRHEHMNHREVYRPWGVYDSIDNGARYQVKRITVKPGAKLSVQMHHHRAEHWIVVSGTARVTNGEKTYLVTENQSTYIPVGQVHSLENPGVIDLELIEVQSGSYLGEDDIVRYEDRYGRK